MLLRSILYDINTGVTSISTLGEKKGQDAGIGFNSCPSAEPKFGRFALVGNHMGCMRSTSR